MKNKEKKYTWIFIPFWIVGIAIFLMIKTDNHNKGKEIGEIMDKNFKIEISGIVSSTHNNRGTITFRLKGKVDYPYYFITTCNNSLTPSYLDDFAQRGDSVYKAPNSDELFIFRNGHKYRFVLNKTIE